MKCHSFESRQCVSGKNKTRGLGYDNSGTVLGQLRSREKRWVNDRCPPLRDPSEGEGLCGR